jgi:alkylhydroperoxidase family enzyme
VGSAAGLPDEKIEALDHYATSPLYDERERAALAYADAMTHTGHEITDEMASRLREHFDDDQLVELTMIIAWENSSSKFNHALGVPSQGLWRRQGRQAVEPDA